MLWEAGGIAGIIGVQSTLNPSLRLLKLFDFEPCSSFVAFPIRNVVQTSQGCRIEILA